MSGGLDPRVAAFFRNEVDYAPFGLSFLRGVTPARVVLLALICIASVPAIENVIANSGFNARTLRLWWRQALIHFMICFPYMVLIVWVDRRTAGASLKSRIGAFAAATLLGGLVAAYWLTAWPAMFGGRYCLWPMASLFYYKAVVAGAFCSAVLIFFERERETGRRLLRSRLARVAAERQIVEARLQLLRAQIEPHFLFNSLANVKVLYEHHPVGGRHLLRNLSSYLRRAVETGKEKEATLSDQVAMARGFLEILQERMGERLRVQIDIPAELQLSLVPTLMIGTLVENAVKHGIGPRDTGGSIHISARRDGGALVVQVADDGIGLREESGTGIGLANSRARLESLYPGEGELDLGTNEKGGVTATLRLPLRRAEARVASSRPISETEEVAAISSAPSTLPRRFIRALSWTRCAWALAIGLAYSFVAVLGTFASPYAMLGIASVHRSLEILFCVAVFFLAIVVVEACSDVRQPRGWHYAAGWLGAALLIAGANWTFPDVWGEPDLRNEEARKGFSQFTQPGRVDIRTREMLGARVFIMDGALGILIYVWLRNARRASEALARAEIERTEAERKLVTSQVEAVEAEVDPGFVFSTLETIENTYDRDRAAADAMLDELIAFLRAAIPKVRADTDGETRAPGTAMA